MELLEPSSVRKGSRRSRSNLKRGADEEETVAGHLSRRPRLAESRIPGETVTARQPARSTPDGWDEAYGAPAAGPKISTRRQMRSQLLKQETSPLSFSEDSSADGLKQSSDARVSALEYTSTSAPSKQLMNRLWRLANVGTSVDPSSQPPQSGATQSVSPDGKPAGEAAGTSPDNTLKNTSRLSCMSSQGMRPRPGGHTSCRSRVQPMINNDETWQARADVPAAIPSTNPGSEEDELVDEQGGVTSPALPRLCISLPAGVMQLSTRMLSHTQNAISSRGSPSGNLISQNSGELLANNGIASPCWSQDTMTQLRRQPSQQLTTGTRSPWRTSSVNSQRNMMNQVHAGLDDADAMKIESPSEKEAELVELPDPPAVAIEETSTTAMSCWMNELVVALESLLGWSNDGGITVRLSARFQALLVSSRTTEAFKGYYEALLCRYKQHGKDAKKRQQALLDFIQGALFQHQLHCRH